ncbi:hypothetical protein OKA04_04495 [Luteolibacter flavescens]|uniref:Uncharacterized protein n=1 Tax=Luteolibacter flavescens TaxID=1859460 RepID=A0ABT3FLX6_9BACT|nr:hypothetical protein [Luteolibacter flavescens]MCW1883975.1 hypothetical protein [Luteolibacter flavescens]
MIATEAEVIAFQTAANAALVAACEASGYHMKLRKVFAATYLRGNPRHGLAMMREILAETDSAIAHMRHFQALALGIVADIEASLSPDNTTP